MNVHVRRGRGFALLLILALPLSLSGEARESTSQQGVEAQEPAPAAEAQARGPYSRHPEATKAIAQIKSPYCPGFMLEVCTSAEGHALRDSIAELADQGWRADSIVDWVLARHGPEYLALPRREGKALVAWVVPPLAVALGFSLVIAALMRMIRSRPARPASESDLSEEEEERLRAAMKEMEAEEEVPFL